MLEYPEALTQAQQLNQAIAGKEVFSVLPPTKLHKFCWFNGDPKDYQASIAGSSVSSAEGFGIFTELSFDNGFHLCYNDGVNPRFLEPGSKRPKDYQLDIVFRNGAELVFTVAMYGGIVLHAGEYDNEYYQKSRKAVPVLSLKFREKYLSVLNSSDPRLSMKALLAADQRFPGIGNGVLQDVLFTAGLHPKRKLGTLFDAEKEQLYSSLISVVQSMTEKGGRDTEKDIFGNAGGYHVLMSKNSLKEPCPVCGGEVRKETYMGGSVYYCPHCQPLEK